MLELVNRVCELSGENARAQIIIQNKEAQIEQMQKFIDEKQTEYLSMNERLNIQLKELNDFRRLQE